MSQQPIPTLKTGFAHTHPEPISGARYSAVELMPGDRTVLLLDQRKLPRDERYEFLVSLEQVAEAIEKLMVRGAPAIGVAAAYGMVLAAVGEAGGATTFVAAMEQAKARLVRTRPTAVNLAWAAERMLTAARGAANDPLSDRVARLAAEARALHREDVLACKKIGALGAAQVADGATLLTHCNAGALATGGYGTALGVVRAAHEAGKRIKVIACETRPVLQGARITAWELTRDGIPVTLVTDNMVAWLMANGAVDQVIVGADRVARSGDVANKIGTYGVACLAKMHDVPFDVAAPWSTVDLECEDGAHIPIEERSTREVTTLGDTTIAPDGIAVKNPAFDVTPARMVRAIYTERGVVSPVGDAALLALR